MKEENIKLIATVLKEIKYNDWCKIKVAIDKKFSSAQSKANQQLDMGLKDTDELVNAIKLEMI